jgi:hypothetical protein
MNERSASYISMPLSPIQKGAIGQFAFLATALVTGKGQVEIYTPAIDNEGRDAEIRRHLKGSPGVGIQVKVAFRSVTLRRTKYLDIRFGLPETKVQNDPRLWYFFAIFDSRQLRLGDPSFLIRSDVFHTMARRPSSRGLMRFSMMASLAPSSHDRWSPFRVAPNDLGKRLLEIVDEMGRTALRVPARVPLDGVWLSRAVAGGVTKVLRAAANDANYDLIRSAVLNRNSLSAWYKGHLRLFSPFLLGTRAGDPHVLGYQFDGTSEKALAPEGSPENWRCLRVAELTQVAAIPGIWHAAPKGKGHQHCIDKVDVSAYRPLAGKHLLGRAA